MSQSSISSQPKGALTLYAEMLAEQQQDDTPYFAALGKFVVEYAGAEIALHEWVRKLSDLSPEKAEIVFGKMRRKDVADRINLLMKLEKIDDEKIEFVERCIKQLEIIAVERGKLVHNLVTVEQPILFSFIGKHIKVQNPLKNTKQAQLDQRSIFTLEHITEMSFDCTVIHLRILSLMYPQILEGKSAEQTSYIRCAWLYKLPQPNAPQSKPLKARKARKLQRVSSRK